MESSISISKAASNSLESKEALTIYSELQSLGYKLMIDKKDYGEIVKSCPSSVDNYIKKGYGCPNYKKLGSAKNSKVLFSLVDVAKYLAGATIETL